MMLNSLSQPGGRKRRKRVGRGASAGGGKTCGRGHKGQGSRSGAGAMRGFEGGQMPLQRRLPKVGFVSRTARYTARIRTSEIAALGEKTVDLALLKKRGLARFDARAAKVFLSGELAKPVKLTGIAVTVGARKAIEEAGGSIEDATPARESGS
ncbi:MAG: 50S ribosomal protein L15 [Gammaproteobacteria bacterium]|nr:50S ribosomal protein L15 [Gammaproteobacteria bacterium]